MKRLTNIMQGFLGTLTLVGLVVALILTLEGSHKETKPASHAFQSPIETPTESFNPPRATSTPQATLRPTSTRPPEPPTRTPTPEPTPAPPTPTPDPLPTLIPGAETLLYVTTGERGPEIYRVQLDQTAHMIASPCHANTPMLWGGRVYVSGLHPSPDGRLVAVSWVYGEGGTFISILDVSDGTLTSPFGEDVTIDQRVEFLDWSPAGDQLLVVGGIDNPDLGGKAWLLDPASGRYEPVELSQASDGRQITSASFSPDGQAIVYAKSDCFQCGSDVWRIFIGQQGEKQLLLQDAIHRIEDVSWSPDGRYIAFTQWYETTDGREFATGDLWVMDPRGDARRRLSPVTTGYYGPFTPVWSPDGLSIAYVLDEEPSSERQASEPSFNVYVVNVATEEIRQLTHFQNTQVLGPIFSPDGSMLVVVAALAGVSDQFEPWLVTADGRGLRRLDERANPTMNTGAAIPAIAWLPEFSPGDER